jgi:predicted GH43/DUF377 family glycosyl hydrolase
MRWVKRGLIFQPPRHLKWMVTHAAVPCAQRLAGDMYRVYFAGRDADNRSRIGCFEIDLNRPDEITYVSQEPLLGCGQVGAFDDNGVMPSWTIDHDGKTYLYYIGWNLGVTVPFYNSIGLAVSADGGRTFERLSQGPILGRDTNDPFFTGSSCVLVEDTLWRMWYLSCSRWDVQDGQPKHYYHLKYAESEDGIHWKRTGLVAIAHKSEDEYAISRPSVIKDDALYRMWYSYRGESYRIGYAESADGIRWERKDDKAGIDVSPSGWDSEMIEYPFVFDHEGERYMLYNGDGYGESGIGLAVLAE